LAASSTLPAINKFFVNRLEESVFELSKVFILGMYIVLVGEYFCLCRRFIVRYFGVLGKVNVGISNDKGGEMFFCCKIKVFWVMLIVLGLVGF